MSSATVPLPLRAASGWLRHLMVRTFGLRGLLWQHDPPTYDRWLWLRDQLVGGSGRTLDAGSGSGAFAMYAASLGNYAIGLSFDPAANEVASHRAGLLGIRRVRFGTADLRALDRLGRGLGTFDQIICLETIEHLVDDQKLLIDLARLLRTGGRLYLTTPTIEHRALVGETLSATEDGGHVRWGYSADQLRELMGAAGFAVVSVDYLSGAVIQQITNLARVVAKGVGVHGGWALTAPLRLLRIIDRPLTRLVGGKYLAIAVVGVKR